MPTPQTSFYQRRRGTNVPAIPPEFISRTIEVRRVSRMVAGGRRFRFRVLVVVGNKKGTVGMGVGKGLDVPRAVDKATRRARASCVTVPRRGGTIPREITVKYGTSRIIMRPAKPGHGIVAGGIVRIICDLAGITDISAKILSRSTNNLSNGRAVISGLQELSERIAVAGVRRKELKKENNNKE